MTNLLRVALPLVAAAWALAGCVAYPAGYGYAQPGYGYGYGYAPTVAVAVPCCAYGYGYHRGYR